MRRIIQKILREELDMNKKKFFNSIWDKEKKEKGYVIFDEKKLKKFGTNSKNKLDIWKFFNEWVGNESKFEEFEDFIDNKKFDSKEILGVDNDPHLHFQFILHNFNFISPEEVECSFEIISGHTTNEFENEFVNIQTGNNEIDDFLEYFEFQNYIKDVLIDFIISLAFSFGIEIHDITLKEEKYY